MLLEMVNVKSTVTGLWLCVDEMPGTPIKNVTPFIFIFIFFLKKKLLRAEARWSWRLMN